MSGRRSHSAIRSSRRIVKYNKIQDPCSLWTQNPAHWPGQDTLFDPI